MVAQKVKLDIGGCIFAPTRSLLLLFEGSFFHAMLSSGRWPPRRNGMYFVDRPSTYFEPMLHFMRTGQLSVAGWTPMDVDLLREEFDFYQITLPASIGVHACEGRWVQTWGTFGRNCGQFHYPSGLVVSASNEVCVTDAMNNRIQVVDTAGTCLRTWGSEGLLRFQTVSLFR